mgnify:FL=1
MGRLKQHRRYSAHVTRGARWRTLRAAVLERDGYRCRSCGARGRLEIDHVEPVRTAPHRAYDPHNLQALCPKCHGLKTRQEIGLPKPDPIRAAWRDLLSQPIGKGHNDA